MAEIGIKINPTIVKNGGPITSDVYKSHATNLWTKGSLLKLSSGLLTPCVTSATAVEIDTDDTGATSARLFIALEDHLTAGSIFKAVQEIKADTIIEAQLLASSTTAPTTANVSVGANYTGYMTAAAGATSSTGLWGIDVDDTTKPVFNVVDVSSNYNPFDPDAKANHAKVLVKVLSAILA